MIIPKLVEYYDRLAADPDVDVAPYGFSQQKISFEIVLHPDGRLHSFADARVEDGKRRVPRRLIVPGQAKPRGPGINPGFLWDNAQYMLGFKPDDPKPARSRAAFEAFRDRHIALRNTLTDDAYQAVCTFLEHWSPEQASEHEQLAELTSAFGVFRIVGAQEYVHDRPAVLAHLEQTDGTEPHAPTLPSLTNGKPQHIARLHEPPIKDVGKGRSPNAKLVNFNDEAYKSYGKSQSFNAPVGEADAFKYCTALNHLTSNRKRRALLGDTTVVYWAGEPTAFENEFISALEQTEAEDQSQLDRVASFLNRLRRAADGTPFDESASNVPFYVLGLEAPNPGRISVRFWLVGTVQQFAARLGQHLSDLEIGGKPDQAPPLTMKQLVRETARPEKGWPDDESIHPALQSGVMRAILTDAYYPRHLLTSILARIKAEGFCDPNRRKDWRSVAWRRAAILKAYLERNEGISMETYLNKSHPSKAYHCGRLFATLAFAQEVALESVNAGLVRRHMASVMAMPGYRLGALQRAASVAHLPKLQGNVQGFIEDEIKSTNSVIRDEYPLRLNMREQGLFALGFYQETHYLERKLGPNAKDRRLGKKRVWQTDRGEWVRSRREQSVANAMAKFNIPYIFEPAVHLAEFRERWTDFYIPGTRSHPPVYIEVLGVVGNETYNNDWEEKLAEYHASKITEEGGENGRLVIFDLRDSNIKSFDETTVLNKLNFARIPDFEESSDLNDTNKE